MKKNYNVKKTISTKRFISELGDDFSSHIKEKLSDLEIRCVLTRSDAFSNLDIKHVEHTKYDSSNNTQKEYCYGRFLVKDGFLYFSSQCEESDKAMKSPIVDTIYNSLENTDIICEDEINAKKLNDENIDFVIDNILNVCPDISNEYRKIVEGMLFRANQQTANTSYNPLKK